MEYKHVISLGHACAVAHELERLGYRDHSGPFDWQGSRNFKAHLELIQQGFKPFFNNLTPDTLFQRKELYVYLMKPYALYFVHDFNQYDSLESQLPAVVDKYRRRVDAFYKDIVEPTLFVYYMYDQADADWISSNYDYILSSLRAYNADNNIIFIADRSLKYDRDCFFADNDDGSDIAFNFVRQNNDIASFFENIPYSYLQRMNNIINFRYRVNKKRIKKLVGLMGGGVIKTSHKEEKPEYHHCLTDFFD